MNKILICHHLEPLWSEGLAKNGTSLKKMCKKVIRYLKANPDIDSVIITQFESDDESKQNSAYSKLFKFLDKRGISLTWHEYAYGWNVESFFDANDLVAAQEKIDIGQIVIDAYGTKLVKGGMHSEIIILDAWMCELRNHEIILGGAFLGECLEDIQVAFNALELNYQLEYSLCV